MDNKNIKLSAKHWWVMIVLGLCWYIYTGTNADGLNVIVPGFCEMYGWDNSLILSFSTIAGLIGMVISFFMGRVMDKKGAKYVLIVSGIIAGLAYTIQGYVTSVAMYFITVTLGSFVNIFSAQVTGPIVAAWMPRKRGLAMGVISAFSPICTATYLWYLNAMINGTGFKFAIASQGIIILIITAVAGLTLKNTPEEAGTTPDNVPSNVSAEEELKKLAEYKSPWTAKALLKNKEVWMVCLCFGIMMLANTGVISQLIPRLTIDKGLDSTTATTMFTACAVAGIPLSILWGKVDEWLGTKKATILMLLWFMCSVVMNLVPNNMVTTWISVIMVGGDLGGTANFFTSMTTRLFGRKDFTAAFAIMFPIYNAIRQFAFAYTGFMTAAIPNLFGQAYAGAYCGLIVLCAISIFFISRVDYSTYLGHDDDLGDLA